MNRFKTLCLALTALMTCAVALGASASSASALELPEVKLLAKESFPVTAEGGSKKLTEGVSVQSALSQEMVAEELKVSLEISKEGTSGTAHLDFVGSSETNSKGTKCHTEGSAEGVVLLQGEFHLVPIGVQGEVGIWVSLKEATITCKLKIVVNGSWIALVNQGSVGEGVETATISSHCKGKGTQELSTYWNDEEKPTEKQLLRTNIGLGFENACLEAKEGISLKFSKPITMKAWGKLVLSSPSPWEMKENQERTFLAAYSGVGTAAKITTAFTSGAFIEPFGAVDPCNGKASLVKNETCEVKLKCIGTVGSQGQIQIKTPTWFVSNVEATMKCVA